MKRLRSPLLSIALAGLLVLPGCIVRSVHSWLREDSITFEDDLIGGWTGSDDKGGTAVMTFTRGEANDYIVRYSGQDPSGPFEGLFEGRLGRLGRSTFMDFKPKKEPHGLEGVLLFVPTHGVARLEISSDRLFVYPLYKDPLKPPAKLDPLRKLRYTWAEGGLLITSSSSELQAFLLGLSRDSHLYAPPLKLSRRK